MKPKLFGALLGLVIAFAAVIAYLNSFKEKNTPAEKSREVVCYVSLDQEFSQPVLELFQKRSGITVRMNFDTESTKTIGHVNTLVAEKNKPQCDVFWNNEIVNTIRLKHQGVLQEYRPKAAKKFPSAFRDPDGMWTGFAARARVLIVNTDLVPAEKCPKRLVDLAHEEWNGKIGIAKPLFGTTATWVAALHSTQPTQLKMLEKLMRDGYLKVLVGNKHCAVAVGKGELHMAFTDTDDAIIEKENGKPVELVYLDGGSGDFGNLFFPNTLSLVKDCPNPDNGKILIDFLLSPEVEIMLARGESAQIPLNPDVETELRVATPKTVKPMEVDWDKAAYDFNQSVEWVRRIFSY